MLVIAFVCFFSKIRNCARHLEFYYVMVENWSEKNYYII